MGTVRLYVDYRHDLGGVTTWACQVCEHLGNAADIKVIALRVESEPLSPKSRFPRSVLHVNAAATLDRACDSPPPAGPAPTEQDHGSAPTSAEAVPPSPTVQGSPGDHEPKPVLPTKPTLATIPTIPTLPTLTLPTVPTKAISATRPTLATKPTKITLPTKPTLPDLGEPLRLHSWSDLDEAAKREVEKVELFIPNYVYAAYQHAALSRAMNVPSRCVGYCHTDEEYYYTQLTRYEPIIQTFIAVSRRCQAQLASIFPHRRDDIDFVPYGVPVLADPRKVPVSGCLRLLYSGRLVRKQKRILDFIELIERLEARGVNYSLDFVGSGSAGNELGEAVRKYSRVRLLDAIPYAEMPRVYPNYDVLVLTSETEGLSVAMLEAMSFGVVPVVTRVSGAEDVIVDGENGFLCEVGDLGAMSQRLEYLAGNRGRLATISREAFQVILRGHTLEHHLAKLHSVMDQTMRKPLATVDAAASCLWGTGSG